MDGVRLTTEEAAERLGCSQRLVQLRIRQRILPAEWVVQDVCSGRTKRRGRYLVRTADLALFPPPRQGNRQRGDREYEDGGRWERPLPWEGGSRGD